MTVGGIDFDASFFGKDDTHFTTFDGHEIVGREFWRLENAYTYFAHSPLGEDVLPFINIPTPVEIGQVFVMDVHLSDGAVTRGYYRASGALWQNMPVTQEFFP